MLGDLGARISSRNSPNVSRKILKSRDVKLNAIGRNATLSLVEALGLPSIYTSPTSLGNWNSGRALWTVYM